MVSFSRFVPFSSMAFMYHYENLRNKFSHILFRLFDHDQIIVLIFCVEFRELSHLTRDLSQAEKKINVLQMHKMRSISLKMVEVVILSVAQLVTTVIFFSASDKSHVKWDNS